MAANIVLAYDNSDSLDRTITALQGVGTIQSAQACQVLEHSSSALAE